MSAAPYDNSPEPTTEAEAMARDGVVKLVSRKEEVSGELIQKRRYVTRLEIEAEQTEDPRDTVELIKFENEKIRELESRLEGITGAIELAKSGVNWERLVGGLEEKRASFQEAADLVDEEAKLHEEIDRAKHSLHEATEKIHAIRRKVRSIISLGTVRLVQDPGHTNKRPVYGELIGGVSDHAMELILQGHRNAPSLDKRVEQCRIRSEALRNYDSTLFEEFDELKAIASARGETVESI